jgi:hypothetical protein
VKRALRIALPALLAVVLVVVVVYSVGLGAGAIGTCPPLRTDPFGFPLFPPFSEYVDPIMGTDQQLVEVEVLKDNLPCCVDPDGNLVAADCTLERCLVPNVQILPSETCPASCTVFLTIETGGAVKQCAPPIPDPAGGQSNYVLLTGSNSS